MTIRANQFVLLDRDGVLNTAPTNRYVTSTDELSLLDGAAKAVRMFNDSGLGVLVVSNQQCVGKGLLSEQGLDEISAHLATLIRNASGGEISEFFYCRHLAEAGCDCRKPKPGLIHQAQQIHGFDLTKTFLIGDSYKDLEAAHDAGCPSILVLTGNDADRYRSGDTPPGPPEIVATDLRDAAQFILS